MNFVLLVYAAPFTHEGGRTAYQFAEAALERGHAITQIFFYLDGVYTAAPCTAPSTQEDDLTRAWQQLAEDYAVPLHVCVAAATERGMVKADEHHLAAPFQLASLGQFITTLRTADRLLTFGG